MRQLNLGVRRQRQLLAESMGSTNPSGWSGVLKVKTPAGAMAGYMLVYSNPQSLKGQTDETDTGRGSLHFVFTGNNGEIYPLKVPCLIQVVKPVRAGPPMDRIPNQLDCGGGGLDCCSGKLR